jgi:hypothetical protein
MHPASACSCAAADTSSPCADADADSGSDFAAYTRTTDPALLQPSKRPIGWRIDANGWLRPGW